MFVLPHGIEGDGRIRYLALAELVEWRDISRVPYSMIGPLSSSPLYVVATILTYSGRPGFSYPLFFGVLSVLFSFGKGLVCFMRPDSFCRSGVRWECTDCRWHFSPA